MDKKKYNDESDGDDDEGRHNRDGNEGGCLSPPVCYNSP